MNFSIQDEDTIRLAAVGDLLLACDPSRPRGVRQADEVFRNYKALFVGCDVVLGNLECALPGDGRTVATEPRVVSCRELVRGIQSAGFHIVSLANNHVFDCLEEGFLNVRRLLQEMGVAYFGAGRTITEAARPAILSIKGLRLGFLGAVDERCGPCQLAGPDRAGVCPLDVEQIARQISELRRQVDHVIVSVHWGQERFLIPSPDQMAQAHALVDAGASLVLGHHPHVIQGLELYRGAPIIYSLGSFVACEVPYDHGDRLTWNVRERTGCILLVELTRTGCHNVRQVATFDDGRQVGTDPTRRGLRHMARVNRIVARGVSLRRYRRECLWVNGVRPVLAHLRWSQLRRLRLAHIRKALAGLVQARKVH